MVTSVRDFTAGLLRTSSRAYAMAAIAAMRVTHPHAVAVGLPRAFASPVEDTEVRLLQLAESIGVDRPALIAHSMRWYKVGFHYRDVDPAYLGANLDAIDATLRAELPPQCRELIGKHLAAAREALASAPVELPSLLSRSAPHGDLAARFLLASLEGRGDDAVDLLRGALAAGIRIEDLHDHVLTVTQREAGRMWIMGEIPIADEHYGSGVVDRSLWMLQDHVPRPPAGAKVVLTMGVGGNLHDFGLRLIGQRLQLAGFAVHHLGANMPANDMEWALQDRHVDLVAISATLTLHLSAMQGLIASVRMAQEHQGRSAPILVGGEPFRVVADLHRLVGADAGAFDAAGAIAAARQLVGVGARH
jgi:MerR family transcriptional regulator, light-induced transcriptional regulator